MVCDNGGEVLDEIRQGLNPYSIGIWSATEELQSQGVTDVVLILILLEYGLRLRAEARIKALEACLNPYSIGIWSAT